jgi:hypothetical protein
MSSKGLFVPVSKDREWLLRWWWLNYTLNCSFPVTFIQEGTLSPRCEKWCKMHSYHQEFDTILWIEPWCQIRGSLNSLFSQADCQALCATSPTHHVICFKKDSELAAHWKERKLVFKKNPTQFNYFLKFQVCEQIGDFEPNTKILNRAFYLNILRQEIQLAEESCLIKLSF